MKKKNFYLGVSLLLSMYACSWIDYEEIDYLPDNPDLSLVSDAKTYFDSIVVDFSKKKFTNLEKTLYPGEITPLWQEAYYSCTKTDEYIAVPVNAEYRFVVRETVETETKTQYRYVIADQVISFRRNRDSRQMKAMYITLVPTKGYYQTHKDNLTEKYFGSENYGEFSGFALFNSYSDLGLHILTKFENGIPIYRTTRSSQNIEAFKEEVSTLLGNRIIIRKAAILTRSGSEEENADEGVIDGGVIGEVVVVGEAPGDDENEEEDNSNENEEDEWTENEEDKWDYGGDTDENGGYVPPEPDDSNQVKAYTLQTGDKFSRANLSSSMSIQLPNTCMTSIMEYINNSFCGGTVNQGVYDLDYLTTYGIWVYEHGVSLANITSFVERHFYTIAFTGFTNAVDNGRIVMTDVTSDITNTSHNVAVVGYHPNGTLIYMDPEKGCFWEAPASNLNLNYAISITGCK